MTTFIDFRYSRALAAALFAGQEKEEADLTLSSSHDNYLALAIDDAASGTIAALALENGEIVARLSAESQVLSLRNAAGETIVESTLHVDDDCRAAPFALTDDDITFFAHRPKRFIRNLGRSGKWEPHLEIQLPDKSKPYGFFSRIPEFPVQQPGSVLHPFFRRHHGSCELRSRHELIMPNH